MKKQLLAMLLAGAATVTASAIPARRATYQKIGPDGTMITVQKVGDEYGHHYVDAEGRALISAGNHLVYATEAQMLERDARRQDRFEARNSRRKSLSRVPGKVGLFPGTSFPSKGEQKAIVILVEYKDVKFKVGTGAAVQQYYTAMLNEDGFSQQGGTGSAREYFRDNSDGQFDCQFDVFGPVTLKNNMKYYGGNDSNGDDLHPEEMVIEACDALNSTVNFKDYDRDGDGVIDNVYVIYAGYGEASYDDENTVWPHSWDLTSAGVSRTYDGVKLDTYGCSNEWEEYVNDGAGGPDGIGTFVHEFSHILGLPDLYHTERNYIYYTPGAWSVLDYGPYNNDGHTPAGYSAFERNALGWIELTELTADAGEVTIPELSESNSAYVITNPRNSSEFYLLESRAKVGWDKYLPGEGMLIWHVDYNYSTWQNNSVNNTQSHQGVDLVEADGKTSKQDRNAGDCFPGTSNVTTCSPKWWTDGSTGIKLTGIARNSANNSVTFTTETATSGGSGDSNDPSGDWLRVADVIDSELGGQKSTVRGYIVGYVDGGNWYHGATFSADYCEVVSNIMIADSRDESDIDYCIPVQLPSGATRNAVNLADNPSNLGRYVELDGSIDKYCGVPGLKSVTACRFIDEPGMNAISEISTGTDSTPAAIYDLSGRRIAAPGRHGIYIINGRKVLK